MSEVLRFKLSLITATHHRSEILAQRALPSVLQQQEVPGGFEWIVINDGADPQTTRILEEVSAPFPIRHIPIAHPSNGFGLCHARNRGLQAARGEIVAYLDDDNAVTPDFAIATAKFFDERPGMSCSMALQRRRRDRPGKQGHPFISPDPASEIASFIRHDALFDSNGFSHRREGAPCWNPDFRIFCDYEYFLRCLQQWGEVAFSVNPKVLVDYVQTTEGIIGQSSYSEWAEELHRICTAPIAGYPAIQHHLGYLESLGNSWHQKASHPIPAFVPFA